jgi:plasmid maintenance system antidote protein VapI
MHRMNEETPGERLKRAREQKMKFATASQAARFLNVATPTYLSHENGTRKISAEWADRYAEAFSISPTWLLYNRGAMDEDNTFVRPVASSAPVQRNPARMQSSNPLLSIFEVNYASDGALRPLPGVRNTDAPAWLPTVSAANGFIAELVYAPFPERESRRIVQIGGMEHSKSVLFGLDDFIRLPPDMLSSDVAFAVRLRTADLIESVSGYDRAVVDPGDRIPFRAAFYYVIMNKKASMVYMVPSEEEMDHTNYPKRVWVYETRFEDPKDWSLEAIIVIGRIVTMIMTMSEQLRADFAKPLPFEQFMQRRLAGRTSPGLPPPRHPLRTT